MTRGSSKDISSTSSPRSSPASARFGPTNVNQIAMSQPWSTHHVPLTTHYEGTCILKSLLTNGHLPTSTTQPLSISHYSPTHTHTHHPWLAVLNQSFSHNVNRAVTNHPRSKCKLWATNPCCLAICRASIRMAFLMPWLVYLVHSALTARFLGHEAAPGPSGPSSLLQSPGAPADWTELPSRGIPVSFWEIPSSWWNWRYLRWSYDV